MADQPRVQQPYSNLTPAVSYTSKQDVDATAAAAPRGPKASKVSQAQLAMQGLIGARA